MNRALPPGDRGNRGSNPGWKSRLAGPVPGAGGLVGRTAAADWQETLGTGARAPVASVVHKVALWSHRGADGETWAACGVTVALVCISEYSELPVCPPKT